MKRRRSRGFSRDLPQRRRAVELRVAQVQGTAAQVSVILTGMLEVALEAMRDLDAAMETLEGELASLRKLDSSTPATIEAAVGPDTVAAIRHINRFAAATAAARETKPPLALVRNDEQSANTPTGTRA